MRSGTPEIRQQPPWFTLSPTGLMLHLCNSVLIVILVVVALGSLVGLSSNPHWFIRAWDFPRLQLIATAWMATGAFLAINVIAGQPVRTSGAWFLGVSIAVTAWHLFRIFPYTPLISPQARSFVASKGTGDDSRADRLRVVISNVR